MNAIIFQEPPFLQKTWDDIKKQERLTGFIPDLVLKVTSRLRVPYDLRLVSYGGYGVKKHDGNWTGMLGEIISGVR